jgi:hypothetical protein
MNMKGPKIRDECATLAPYFQYSFTNYASPAKVEMLRTV